MTSADALQAAFKNDRDLFLNSLSSFTLVDIGVIKGLDENGRAHVVSSTFMLNKPIEYTDAEIIYPGNANGTYACNPMNMACLIFVPRSCMPDVSNLLLRTGTPSYNRDGVKAMPIGNGSGNLVQTLFSDGGSYGIIGQKYKCIFDGDTITIEALEGRSSLSVDNKGQLYVRRAADNGTYSKNIEDTGVTTTWLSKNKDVLWTDTLNLDGSRTFVQKDPRDQEGDPLFSFTVTKEGKVVFTNAVDIDLTVTGNANITIDGDDGAAVAIKGDATVSIDGDAKVDASNIELNGNDKRLVTYAELKAAMDKLWIAMTTTPIAGNGSPQPSWTGITSIDISASETQTIKTGG